MSGQLRFAVNGTPAQVSVPPVTRLSQVLREELRLFGTKVGCDAGDCGACTVLVDGEPCCACLTAVGQVSGCEVLTIEGLGANGSLDRLQQSFIKHGAAQCGICTPGMLMSARALLDHEPLPTRQAVADALGGVLCRCTGYRKIIDAVIDASGANEHATEAGAAVGARVRHLDGGAKVTGELEYGADAPPADALRVKVIRSPHHHARFAIGDKEAFIAAHAGIHAVLDAGDVTGVNRYGVIAPFADQPVFAEGLVRFRGEAIAAMVGDREVVEGLDTASFPVEWTPLDPVMTPGQARKVDAPRLHEGREGNLLIEGFVARGDAAGAMVKAAFKVKRRTTTPFVEHAYIEPDAGYATRIGDRLELFGCTQATHMDREEIAAIVGLDQSQVRVVPSACGGAFGSKIDLSFQPYIALAAWKLGRPVAIAYTRYEVMNATTKRHPSEVDIEVGCDRDGRITAMQFDGVFDTGAYASWGPTVASRVPVHASGPYLVPNYQARATAIHTNGPPAGAFRGFGVPQSAIAQEGAYDELADLAGIDRLEFRRINALRDGDPTVTGQVFSAGVGIGACLDALVEPWAEARRRAREFNASANGGALRRGVGLGSCWYGCGNTSLPNPSTIRIGLKRDGAIVLHQGAQDIGQGSNTVIAQIAADALGVPVDRLTLVASDTDLTPDAGKTSASRQTFITGNAARLAGQALRAQLLRRSNLSEPATIELADGEVRLRDEASQTTLDLRDLEENEFGYVLMAQETYDAPTKPLDENGQGEPYALYGYGAQMVELLVDIELGTVRLEHLTTAHDVGKAINPMLVEGQIEGGAAQGIGMALMEEFIPGRSDNLHDYLIPTIGDVPTFTNIIVEVADPLGPYGAKGLGEHALIPTAPAILSAIRDAIGVAIRDLPATPDRVRAAILAANGGSRAAR